VDSQPPVKVFLVDDHPVYRLGIKAGLQKERNIEIVGEAAVHPDALLEVEESGAEVVVIGVPEHPIKAVELCRSIEERPSTRCLVLCRGELDTGPLSRTSDSANVTFVRKAIPLTDLISLLVRVEQESSTRSR
jgi:DNA-binding NarL/FixJ family response regulator